MNWLSTLKFYGNFKRKAIEIKASEVYGFGLPVKCLKFIIAYMPEV